MFIFGCENRNALIPKRFNLGASPIQVEGGQILVVPQSHPFLSLFHSPTLLLFHPLNFSPSHASVISSTQALGLLFSQVHVLYLGNHTRLLRFNSATSPPCPHPPSSRASYNFVQQKESSHSLTASASASVSFRGLSNLYLLLEALQSELRSFDCGRAGKLIGLFHHCTDLQRIQICPRIYPPNISTPSIDLRATPSHHVFDTPHPIQFPNTHRPLFLLSPDTSITPYAARPKGGFRLCGTPETSGSSRSTSPTRRPARSLAKEVPAWHVPG